MAESVVTMPLEEKERSVSAEKKEYAFANETGDATLLVYNVLPGVAVAYHSVHMDQFDIGQTLQGNLVEIHHCQEGRIEQQFSNGLFYLMPGDMSVAIRSRSVKQYRFPLRHYHGMTIAINVDEAPESFAEYLNGVEVRPMEIAQRLCQERCSFVARSERYVEHIFSEMYSVPEIIRPGYLKIKVLELLMVLGEVLPADSRRVRKGLAPKQVELAQSVAEYLSQRMDSRVTIPELAKAFGVSETTMKATFKEVYGVPIYAFGRIQKMLRASQRLIHTQLSILEIASECGYDNGSKFAEAFRKVFGESPREYRKAHGNGQK